MKRASFLAVFAFFALFILADSGAEAVNKSLSERFMFGGAAQTGESGAYDFDKAHSFIGFEIKHMGLIEVPGFFRDFSGMVNYDAKDTAKSTVEFTAKATSIDTGVGGRDTHLRSADFFEVEKYPDVTFKSTKVEKTGNNWIVTGNLTIKGVTKPVSFPFNVAGFLPADQRGGGKMGVTAETTLNRRDYGVNYGANLPNGAAVLSDQVKINLQIEANKAKEAPKAVE